MTDFLAELRFAARSWRRTPGVAVTVVLTLTLTIAIVAAVFSFADGYLFRPLPFPGADRVYYVRDPQAQPSFPKASEIAALKQTEFRSWGFVEWSITGRTYARMDLDGRSVGMFLYEVSEGFRNTLQLPLIAGRDFTPDEHREISPTPAWISFKFWQREFGGDRAAVGRTLRSSAGLTPFAMTIVGVLGPDVSSFDLNNKMPDAILPGVTPNAYPPNLMSMPMIRVPDGISVDEATARLSVALNAVAPPAAGSPARTVRLQSVLDAQQAGGKSTARLLLVGALLVLALATINIVNVLLTRGMARAQEVATRVALGASRWRLGRLFLTESLMLGTTGIVGGLIAGRWLSDWIASRVPEFPTAGRNLALVPMNFDFRVVVVAIVLGLVVALIGGIIPALWLGRRSMPAGVRTVSGSAGRAPTRFARAMLAFELVVATTVMVGTLSIGLGNWRFLNHPTGLNLEDRLEVMVSRKIGGRTTADEINGVAAVLRQLPNVRAASVHTKSEIRDLRMGGEPVSRTVANAAGVTHEYFAAWGTRVLTGRVFTEQEHRDQADVALVDQKAAHTLWPSVDPIGQLVTVDGRVVQVIGVTEHRRVSLTDEIPGSVFVPRAGSPSAILLVWAPGVSVAELKGRLVPAVDNAVPSVSVNVGQISFASLFARQIGEPVFQAPIVTTFGLMAFALAGIGVYGLVSFLTVQRRREYGVRIALGARPDQIWTRVVRESVIPAALGLIGGVAVARALEAVVESSIFGWKATGLVPIALVAVALFVVAVGAASVPARRAMRVDPAEVLRSE